MTGGGAGAAASGAGLNVSATTMDGIGGLALAGKVVVVVLPGPVVVVVVVTGNASAEFNAPSSPPHPAAPVGTASSVNPESTIDTEPVLVEYPTAPCALVPATTWNGPTMQPVIVPVCVQISSKSPAINAAPLVGSSPPVKSLVATACTVAVVGAGLEEVEGSVELDASAGCGRLTGTTTGSNVRLAFGILMTPFFCIDAAPKPVVDIPATVKLGVETVRFIVTSISPGLATRAPAPGARRGAPTATASANIAATASRRFLAFRLRFVPCSTPHTG